MTIDKFPGEYIDMEITPEGNLKLTLTDEGSEEISHKLDLRLYAENKLSNLNREGQTVYKVVDHVLQRVPVTMSEKAMWIHDIQRYTDSNILIELLEDHLCNGWSLIDPVKAGFLVGDDTIILSRDEVMGDNGDYLWIGEVYRWDYDAIYSWTGKLPTPGGITMRMTNVEYLPSPVWEVLGDEWTARIADNRSRDEYYVKLRTDRRFENRPAFTFSFDGLMDLADAVTNVLMSDNPQIILIEIGNERQCGVFKVGFADKLKFIEHSKQHN